MLSAFAARTVPVAPSPARAELPVTYCCRWLFGGGAGIVRLSGTALALLIILLDLQSGRPDRQWVSPREAKLGYDLSADTWTKGTQELERVGLLSIFKQSLGGDVFDYRRTRNAYWVDEEMLQAGEEWQEQLRAAGLVGQAGE